MQTTNSIISSSRVVAALEAEVEALAGRLASLPKHSWGFFSRAQLTAEQIADNLVHSAVSRALDDAKSRLRTAFERLGVDPLRGTVENLDADLSGLALSCYLSPEFAVTLNARIDAA